MPFSTHSIPELLAPAGSTEALRAAISGGADAVYVGLDRFNARRSAENFTIETLAQACEFAHMRGVKIYLTANVVILPAEMQSALDMVSKAWAVGVDAVIVQDLGLLRVLRQTLPHVRVHASTQLNVHASDTVRTLASQGVSRITLARETSLTEIATLSNVAASLGVEVESFVHGAICVCYSGQCLMSSMIGGRSANRGACAQPCRLPYELVDEKNKVQKVPGAHLLSPKDLAGLTVLDGLAGSGVAALKIEGRMKSAEYVALVTGVYRKALDRAAADGRFEVRDGELDTLNEAFSRGFSEAYLIGERGNDMMSYSRPNNRGVPVGRVAKVAGSEVTIALDAALDARDTIEVWTSRGRFAQVVGALEVGGSAVHVAPAGSKAAIRVTEPVSAGDRVFRVRNAALTEAAMRTFTDGAARTLPVDVSVKVVVGEPLEVTVRDEAGRTGTGTGPVVEPARTRAVTSQDIIDHVGRFGGTSIHARNWDIDLSPEAGVGFSVLHRVRREAVEAHAAVVLEPWSGRETAVRELPALPKPWRNDEPAPRLVAAVNGLSAAKACLQAGCESVYVPASALLDLEPGTVVPRGVIASLPRVAHDAEVDRLLAAVDEASRAQAATLGTLSACASRDLSVEAHWSLNAANAYTVAELRELGASFAWLSPELSSRQVAEVCSASPLPVGIAVSGRQELMVTEHCILMTKGPCSQRCETCPRRKGWHFLRDRKGYSFPVHTDASGRSHVFNSVPLDLTHALPEVLATGVSALRLDLETETPNRAAAEVARVRQALQDTLAGREPERVNRDKVTSGHFFRGVG